MLVCARVWEHLCVCIVFNRPNVNILMFPPCVYLPLVLLHYARYNDNEYVGRPIRSNECYNNYVYYRRHICIRIQLKRHTHFT